jgi:hypothetical protein
MMSEMDDAKEEAWRLEQSVLDKRDAQIYRLKKLIDDDKKIISELLVLLEKRSGSFWFGEEWDLIKRARKATRRASRSN